MNPHRSIPLVDLRAQTASVAEELQAAIADVLSGSHFILGDEVQNFEDSLADYCDTAHAVGVSSGLSALHMALRAVGIGPGDEVITAANTFAATVLAILHAGAKPVLVDVDEVTATLDTAQVAAAVTSRTRAIIPVHLYGQPADMAPLWEISRRHHLVVIEDAAQAHGALYRGRKAGSLGTLGCFSFYPSKNLGAAGDGGAVVSSDPELVLRLRLLRNYGQQVKNQAAIIGFNERLDTLQAAVLNVKLRRLDQWNDLRREHAHRYNQLLAGLPVVTPVEAPGRRHVYHLYVIRTSRREELSRFLAERGIATGIHYPVPIHRQPAFSTCPFVGQSFPVTERLSREILSLPMYPELSAGDVEHVCGSIAAFFRSAAHGAEEILAPAHQPVRPEKSAISA